LPRALRFSLFKVELQSQLLAARFPRCGFRFDFRNPRCQLCGLSHDTSGAFASLLDLGLRTRTLLLQAEPLGSQVIPLRTFGGRLCAIQGRLGKRLLEYRGRLRTTLSGRRHPLLRLCVRRRDDLWRSFGRSLSPSHHRNNIRRCEGQPNER
jgi:hypothetical protein